MHVKSGKAVHRYGVNLGGEGMKRTMVALLCIALAAGFPWQDAVVIRIKKKYP